MFRAFLGYTKEEVDELSIGDYIDSTIMLTEALRILHAPFQKED